MASSYNKYLFKFNLVPPKTKEELQVLEDRDNSILYSSILIFAAMFIFFVLVLIQTVLIDPRLLSSKLAVTNKDKEIAAYDTIKKVNGELFIKSKALEPILEKDIKITKLLEISQKIKENVVASEIVNYSREPSGEFVITFSVSSVDQASLLIKNAKSNSALKDVFLRSVIKNVGETNKANVTIAFSIKNIDA